MSNPQAQDHWQLIAIVLLHKFSPKGALVTPQDVENAFGMLNAEAKQLWVNEHPGGFDLSFATQADIQHAQTSGQIGDLFQ